jgi:hypothetical protein
MGRPERHNADYFPITELNTFSNLQILCDVCNSAKNPDESQEE